MGRKKQPDLPAVLVEADGYVGVEGLASYFQISKASVYRRIENKEIRPVRLGRLIRIPREEVWRFVEANLTWPEGRLELDPVGYFAMKNFARHFKVSQMTAYRRARDEQVPVVRIGRALRVPRGSVDMFVRSKGEAGKPVLVRK